MSEFQVGRNLVFGMSAEAAYNEAWGTPTLVGLYISPDFDFTPNYNHMREMHAHGLPMLKLTDVQTGVKNWKLKIGGVLPREGFSWLLYSLFGKVLTAADGSYYTHYFYPGIGNPPSLKFALYNKLAVAGTANELRLSGGKVTSLQIEYAPNRPVMWTADIIGGNWLDGQTQSTITIPVPTGGANPYWQFDNTGAAISHAGVTDWTKATLKIESVLAEGVDDSYNFGSASRVNLIRAATEDCFKMQINVSRVLSDKTIQVIYDASWASASNDWTVMLGATAAYQFKSYANNSKITDRKLVPHGQGIVYEEITSECFLSSAITEAFILTEDKQVTPATGGS